LSKVQELNSYGKHNRCIMLLSLSSWVILVLLGLSSIAFAQPQSWDFHKYIAVCFFYGTATIDGENVAVGDVVGAFVNKDSVNDLCIGTFTVDTIGAYGMLNAYGDDTDTEEKDGASAGEEIYFKIWDASSDRISYAVPQGDNQWQSGADPKEVNLSATSGISANDSGTRQDTFELGETIYGQAVLGLQAGSEYDLYVIDDRSSWSEGDLIPLRVTGSASSFTADGNGNMPTGTSLYSNPMSGDYDIVIDVNGNGIYNDNVDYLDDSPAVGAIVFAMGDVSQEGNVTPYDASLVLQYVAGLKNLSTSQLKAADVTGDGNITAFDAALILQYTVGLITQFPLSEEKHRAFLRKDKRNISK
jgi:hypothetical protein